jgi:hypothetical protein
VPDARDEHASEDPGRPEDEPRGVPMPDVVVISTGIISPWDQWDSPPPRRGSHGDRRGSGRPRTSHSGW